MAGIKLLIKFFSQDQVENIISSLSLQPEILLPVGYGHVVDDRVRNQLNLLFHRRGIKTIVMEPMRLRMYREPDTKAKLKELFLKYSERNIVIDLSGADRFFSMALGELLAEHPEWNLPVLDIRTSDGTFFPQKQIKQLRGLSYPKLTGAEIRFLNGISDPMPSGIRRKDLTQSLVRAIQLSYRFVQKKPNYWKSVSNQFKMLIDRTGSSSLQLLADENAVMIPEEALTELLASSLLTEYVKKSHIVRISFETEEVRRLLMHLDHADTFRAFLTIAGIRNIENEMAAFHELMLIDETYITCIYLTTPYVMQVIHSGTTPEELYHFFAHSETFYGRNCRKILIASKTSPPDESLRPIIRLLQLELIPIDSIVEKLEPR